MTTTLFINKCGCGFPGLQNPKEFSFTSDEETQEQSIRRAGYHTRDQKKLDSLKKRLHTDDECECRGWGQEGGVVDRRIWEGKYNQISENKVRVRVSLVCMELYNIFVFLFSELAES